MDRGLVDTAAQAEAPDDRRIYGVAVARVVKNCDDMKLGRVQVRLPWLPGYEPWARIAAVDKGVYFIPQAEDEVLVAFNHGDVTDLYVIGTLWNGKNRPKPQEDSDPVTMRTIHTPLGHEMVFDDKAKSITIKSPTGQSVTLGPEKIEVTTTGESGTAAIALDKNGNITIQATNSITLKAPTINVLASDNLALGGSSSARIDGGANCSIQAAKIYIG